MSDESNPKPPKDVEAELDLLKGLLAQQQEAQQRQQRAIAQQALDLQIAQARAVVPAPIAVAPAPKTPSVSTVRSKPISSDRRKETAVIRGEVVDHVAVGVMRYGAVCLLGISFLGSVVALNGGWQPVIDAWPYPWMGISPLAAIVGIGLQAWLTLIQWYKRHDKRTLLYITHLAIDATLTFLGYYPILVPFFAGGIEKLRIPAQSAEYAAYGLTAILAFVLAKIPEEMLVDG